MKKIIITIQFVIIAIIGLAQTSWENYPTTNCFRITSIAVDNDFVWVGSSNGIVKFNKVTYEQEHITSANSDLPSNYVNSITVDGYNNKWIGTNSGLAKLGTDNIWSIYNTINSDIPTDTILSVSIDYYANKWITNCYCSDIESKRYLTKFDDTSWDIYNSPSIGKTIIENNNSIWAGYGSCCESNQFGVVNYLFHFTDDDWSVFQDDFSWMIDIEIDENGVLWMQNNGICRYDKINFTQYSTSNSDLPSNAVGIEIDNNQDKWIITESGGLVKFDNTNWTIFNTSNSAIPSNNLLVLEIDNNENKWFVTENLELVKYDAGSWESYPLDFSILPFNHINSITLENNIKWFGSDDAGVFKLENNQFTNYNTNNSGLTSNQISSIFIDDESNKWITTFGGGLAKFDNSYWTIFNTDNSGLPSNDIYNSIVEDNDGNKWIATYGGGIAIFDNINWTVYNSGNSGLPNNYVVDLEIDSYNNKWFVVYEEGNEESAGIVKFDGINWTFYNSSNSGIPSGGFISSISIDANDNKWIATENGLVKFDNTDWTLYDTSNSGLPVNRIFDIAIDETNNIWVTTQEGLVKYDNAYWQLYNTGNSNILSNLNWRIMIDNNNKYLTSECGLSIFNENGTTEIEETTVIEQQYNLRNYPNPFSNNTIISFQLSKPNNVKLQIFDISGNMIQEVVNQHQDKGNYQYEFNTSGNYSGIYFCRLITEDEILTHKMIIMK